jgi:hypothetical protein
MLTLADFAKLIADGAPLDTPIQPVWALGPPNDDEPAVGIDKIALAKDGKSVELGVYLSYLNEDFEGDDQTTPVYLNPDDPRRDPYQCYLNVDEEDEEDEEADDGSV